MRDDSPSKIDGRRHSRAAAVSVEWLPDIVFVLSVAARQEVVQDEVGDVANVRSLTVATLNVDRV